MTAAVLIPSPPSTSLLTAFITRHQHLLALERAAEEEQTRLLNSNCSPKLLEQRGLALGSLGVASISVGLGGKHLVELCRPLAYHTDVNLPPHTFRNGDPVRIETHVSNQGKGKKKKEEDEDQAVEGIVYRVSQEKIVVAVDGAKEVDLPERLRLLKLANTVTFDRMDKTMLRLSKAIIPDSSVPTPDTPNLSLIEVLLGIETPRWLNSVPETISSKEAGSPSNDVQWLGTALNDSQKEAIEFCLKAQDLACIHGPPGTGKTHTLIELICQLLLRPAASNTLQPPRILVTTPSNLALDNLLLRLHALSKTEPYASIFPSGSILRLGHPTRVHKDLIRETLDWRSVNGDEGQLVDDVGKDIQGHLGDLAKKKGEKGSVKGKERGKKWEEVRILRKEYRQREAKVVTNVVKAAKVVLATCHSAGSRQLSNMMFDVCIVDEATQAVEAVCWVPILKSKKLILAGDPQQLPPTIMSKADAVKSAYKDKTAEPSMEGLSLDTSGNRQDPVSGEEVTNDYPGKTKVTSLIPPRTLETTLFQRLESIYGPGIKRVLQVQYRMNASIASFPSATLYENNLVSAPSVASHRLLDLPSILDRTNEDAKETLEPPVVFFDTAGCEFYERSEGEEGDKSTGEGSKSNENEAEIVVKWARKLIDLGVTPSEIAVVTPYQAQVSLISSLLHGDFPDMTIGSAIILTLVRSNNTGQVGFLSEYRRLNVAMTRAKRQLCVVGDSSTVGKGSKYLKNWMDWLENNADVRYAGDETI
ncbi:putative DNA helicase [Kockovaella imperatae]|uniref:DNA helicase n=1 Tax=Kockovaella imperatae TaxID=4999 RepID=A0A1Y1UDN6_9TREE|nr:putative DNA helicase [Kockovaella imperatae]ORX35634.1 putative DNA helicase [Kockovaella imperatae]